MEHAQVSLATVLAIITSLLSIAAAGYGIVLRWAFTTYKEATDKRFKDLEDSAKDDEKELKKEVKDLTTANHALEKQCLKLDGDVRVLTQAHDSSERDIANMVTKQEWEPRMKHLESMLETILRAVAPGKYQSSQNLPSTQYSGPGTKK